MLTSAANLAQPLQHRLVQPSQRSSPAADVRTDGEAWRGMEPAIRTEAPCSPSSLSLLFIQAGGLQQRKEQRQQ